MAAESSTKRVYLELLRILCAGLVIFNHIPGYTLYQTISGPKRIPCLFLTMLTRINVPVFFMITGALLLDRQEDYRTVFRKRVVRILLLIVIAQSAYYCCAWFSNNILQHKETAFSFGALLRGILSGNKGAEAYWFLYAYLGLMLLLPMFQRIARGMNKQDVVVLLGLHFLFSSFIPLTNLILSLFSIQGIGLHSKFLVSIATKGVFFYPLIGYYLDHRVDIRALSSKALGLISLLAVAGIAVSSACTCYQGFTQGSFTQDYVMLFDYVTAIAVFLLVKRLMVVKAPRLSEGKIGLAICLVGSLTLGIYVFDPMLRKLFLRASYFAKDRLLTLVTSFAWVIASMTAGGLLTRLLRFIPGMKKIL